MNVSSFQKKTFTGREWNNKELSSKGGVHEQKDTVPHLMREEQKQN